ncbi:hypothetical protein [Mucilaginibacter jinjuensis]|uniref:Uncharacterized protein n=1 Tax=Mucilaginibacter jinjuensis TaxID=1176721 RepID=A0ABY7TBR9_9SPHI|nr:hypothetical protein [Mucilaginibacter jinjuensis]WCT13510.1 hypothetical protein PQO05_06120 [Mucilaginibacter jinjuensis]
MQAPKPTDFLLLLEVFRRGLILDLVSKSDVTSWADEIILNTDEPDYFFIELSLCSTTNHLIEVIGAYVKGNDSLICTRVLMGLLYKKLVDENNAFTIDDAIRILWNIEWRNTLTDFELSFIYSFDDYGFVDFRELQEDVIRFLSAYAPFTFNNYTNWPVINDLVITVLNKIEAEQEIRIAAMAEEWRVKRESLMQAKQQAFKKAIRKQRLKRHLNISILIAVISAIILCAYFTPITEINWGSIVGTILICGLFIGKEYMLRGKRR